MKAYAKMLDQQEQDRKNEVQARENRAQDFMNRMANGVIREMDAVMKKEDEMILRYEKEREMKLRRGEEDKARAAMRQKEMIVRTLNSQQEEKRLREQDRKSEIN